MFGRGQELHEVCQAVQQGSPVSIVGGPGEGKSTLANEAALKLWEGGACSAGVFVVDVQGMEAPGMALSVMEGLSAQLTDDVAGACKWIC